MFPTFDLANGTISSSSAVIELVGVANQQVGEIAHLSFREGDGPVSAIQLRTGESYLLRDSGYKVTVNTIGRYWLLSHSIHITLAPEEKLTRRRR